MFTTNSNRFAYTLFLSFDYRRMNVNVLYNRLAHEGHYFPQSQRICLPCVLAIFCRPLRENSPKSQRTPCLPISQASSNLLKNWSTPCSFTPRRLYLNSSINKHLTQVRDFCKCLVLNDTNPCRIALIFLKSSRIRFFPCTKVTYSLCYCMPFLNQRINCIIIQKLNCS